MVKISDFIENNDNCKVRISESMSNDTLFEGMLHDIPEGLRGRKVIKEGYAIMAKLNVLTVLEEGENDEPN